MRTTLLTIEEVATALNVSEKTVRRMIQDRRLASVRVGVRSIRVSAVELERYTRLHTTQDVLGARPRARRVA